MICGLNDAQGKFPEVDFEKSEVKRTEVETQAETTTKTTSHINNFIWIRIITELELQLSTLIGVS